MGNTGLQALQENKPMPTTAEKATEQGYNEEDIELWRRTISDWNEDVYVFGDQGGCQASNAAGNDKALIDLLRDTPHGASLG